MNPAGASAMKTRILSVLVVGGMLTLLSSLMLAAPSPEMAARMSPPFSGAINDVVKLAKSGVEESVVLTYIRTCQGAFQPSADEIVKLRDLGISSQVIMAMLERGGELRRQVQQAQAKPAPASTAAPATTQAAPVCRYPASSVVYVGGSCPGYTYPYSYWYYWWSYPSYYWWSYPSYCWWSSCYSCYPRHHYRHYYSSAPRVIHYPRVSAVRTGGARFGAPVHRSFTGARPVSGRPGGGFRHR
jgi:hypothetical protein